MYFVRAGTYELGQEGEGGEAEVSGGQAKTIKLNQKTKTKISSGSVQQFCGGAKFNNEKSKNAGLPGTTTMFVFSSEIAHIGTMRTQISHDRAHPRPYRDHYRRGVV